MNLICIFILGTTNKMVLSQVQKIKRWGKYCCTQKFHIILLISHFTTHVKSWGKRLLKEIDWILVFLIQVSRAKLHSWKFWFVKFWLNGVSVFILFCFVCFLVSGLHKLIQQSICAFIFVFTKLWDFQIIVWVLVPQVWGISVWKDFWALFCVCVN